MTPSQEIFAGGAYQGDDDSAAVMGQITPTGYALRFETEGFTLDLPMQGLRVELDEAGERPIFSHPNYPEWKVYSIEPAILEHRNLQRFGLKDHVAALNTEATGGDRHAKLVYLTLGGLIFLVFGLWAFSGAILGMIVAAMPKEWEEQVGKSAYEEMMNDYEASKDPVLTNRVFLVTERLKRGVPKDAPKFDFTVADDDLVNAFALPGGHIIVMRGLIEIVTPDELAGVLAHEMSHGIERHGMRGLAQMVGPVLIAEYLFDKNGAVSSLVAVSAFVGQLKYSRESEAQADDEAWDILMKANIDPRCMTSMFKKLEAIEGKDSESLLSTHPATSERIAKLDARWQTSLKKSGFTPVNGGTDLVVKEKPADPLFPFLHGAKKKRH